MSYNYDDLLKKGATLVRKFGENNDLQKGSVPQDIWDGGVSSESPVYPFLSNSGESLYISSSNTGDNQPIKIEGLSQSFEEQEKTVYLSGQSKQSVDGTWTRVFRAANEGSTNISGTVYIYTDDSLTSGVPNTPSKIKAEITTEHQQSAMSIYTIPSGYDGYLSSVQFTCDKLANASAVNVHFGLFTRKYEKVFRSRLTHNSSSSSSFDFKFLTPIRYEEKTDFKMTAIDTSSNTVRANASFELLLLRHPHY